MIIRDEIRAVAHFPLQQCQINL